MTRKFALTIVLASALFPTLGKSLKAQEEPVDLAETVEAPALSLEVQPASESAAPIASDSETAAAPVDEAAPAPVALSADPVVPLAMPAQQEQPATQAAEEASAMPLEPEEVPLTPEDLEVFIKAYFGGARAARELRFYDRIERKDVRLKYEDRTKEDILQRVTGLHMAPCKFKDAGGKTYVVDVAVAGLKIDELQVVPRLTEIRKAGREKARYFWELDTAGKNWRKQYPDS